MSHTLLVYRYTAKRPTRSTGSTEPPATDAFVRDAPTLLSYAVLGCWTFWLYGYGPAVTLLRAELGFSYTMLGLYSVVLSLGAALAGAGFARVAARVDRGPLLWCSALATTVGAA